jgi:hypothetical protein
MSGFKVGKVVLDIDGEGDYAHLVEYYQVRTEDDTVVMDHIGSKQIAQAMVGALTAALAPAVEERLEIFYVLLDAARQVLWQIEGTGVLAQGIDAHADDIKALADAVKMLDEA